VLLITQKENIMRKGLAPFNPAKANIAGVILAQKLYNPLCESDDFLSVVLIQRADDDFVVWTHNAQSGGYSCGSYSDSQRLSWDEFNRRGYTPTGGAS
jgi:hypothetical protein